jgi:anhydro-N-acetylmuramic acid kinase
MRLSLNYISNCIIFTSREKNMKKSNRIIAGAMSGTSADGVDVALISITGHGLAMSARLLGHHQLPYEPSIREQIFSTRSSGIIGLDNLAKLGKAISHSYARAVNEALAQAGIEAGDVEAIAAHGQTLFHDPPHTIQWLDPALLAAETGCAVVSDFRRADCAAGGQGAPLVPFADYILFRHPTKNRILLNIGGIANITWLKAGGSIEDVIAFDTGPGNCISDHLSRKHDPTGPGYDLDAQRAKKGQLLEQCFERFLQHSYFWQPPPRSTDTPAMIALFDESIRSEGHVSPDDLFATAISITSISIANSIAMFQTDEVICSGGGAKNPLIWQTLEFLLNSRQISLLKSDDLGVSSDAKEAIAFALLGTATLDGLPSNVPSVTGARRAVILGSITPKP